MFKTIVKASVFSVFILFAGNAVTAEPEMPKYEVGTCTPPGEREYYKEWLLTEAQSLLHKCALGGLIDFNVLAIFDPRQLLLDFISQKACSFVKQQTQPFRDSFNKEVNLINQQINAFNEFQDVDKWLEPYSDNFNRQSAAIADIPIADFATSNFVGNNLVEGEISNGNALNGGAGKDEAGNVIQDPVAPFTPSTTIQQETPPASEGLLQNSGQNGVERFPMPKPAQWGDIYKGIVK